jgi:hypothetical protein
MELTEAIERTKQLRAYLRTLGLPSADREAEALTVVLIAAEGSSK